MTDRRTYGTEWNTGCLALSAAADHDRIQRLSAAELGTGTGDSVGQNAPSAYRFTARNSYSDRRVSSPRKPWNRCFRRCVNTPSTAMQKEIAEGFVTIAGGNRVGIAGSAVYQEGKLVQMRHISGLNFRVSTP